MFPKVLRIFYGLNQHLLFNKKFCAFLKLIVETAQLDSKTTSPMSGCQSLIYSQSFFMNSVLCFPVQLVSVIIPLHIQNGVGSLHGESLILNIHHADKFYSEDYFVLDFVEF